MWPRSLRGRLLILTAVVVALPIVASGYFMVISAKQALVAEKQQTGEEEVRGDGLTERTARHARPVG